MAGFSVIAFYRSVLAWVGGGCAGAGVLHLFVGFQFIDDFLNGTHDLVERQVKLGAASFVQHSKQGANGGFHIAGVVFVLFIRHGLTALFRKAYALHTLCHTEAHALARARGEAT
jgi:hypothetical protein